MRFLLVTLTTVQNRVKKHRTSAVFLSQKKACQKHRVEGANLHEIKVKFTRLVWLNLHGSCG